MFPFMTWSPDYPKPCIFTLMAEPEKGSKMCASSFPTKAKSDRVVWSRLTRGIIKHFNALENCPLTLWTYPSGHQKHTFSLQRPMKDLWVNFCPIPAMWDLFINCEWMSQLVKQEEQICHNGRWKIISTVKCAFAHKKLWQLWCFVSCKENVCASHRTMSNTRIWLYIFILPWCSTFDLPSIAPKKSNFRLRERGGSQAVLKALNPCSAKAPNRLSWCVTQHFNQLSHSCGQFISPGVACQQEVKYLLDKDEKPP